MELYWYLQFKICPNWIKDIKNGNFDGGVDDEVKIKVIWVLWLDYLKDLGMESLMVNFKMGFFNCIICKI